MIVKKTILLLICSTIISCSNFEFVYDFSDGLEKLHEETSLSIEGVDNDIINAYILSKLRTTNTDDALYLLTVTSSKRILAIVVEKDATASKFNIEHEITYNLKNIEINCIIVEDRIKTIDSYDSKSEGYSFGSDLSEKEVTINNIHSNINEFFNILILSKNNFTCEYNEA